MKIYSLVLVLFFGVLNAEEIKMNNKYFKEYSNPFKEVFNEPKNGIVKLVLKNETLKAKIETNKQDNIFVQKTGSYELNKSNLRSTIENMIKENYEISSLGKEVLFDIRNMSVYIGYLEQDGANQISNINAPISNLEVSFNIDIFVKGNLVFTKQYKDSGNLVNYKDRYVGIFTTSDIVLSSDTVEESIANFIEKSIYESFYEAKEKIESNIK